jgi:glycosyltransferase involved in cell wall biosynthesis
MNKIITVLYEISNLGLGANLGNGGFDPKTRTGIFRAIENILEEIQHSSSIEFWLTSCVNLNEAILTKHYINQEKIKWSLRNIDLLYNFLLFKNAYINIVNSIHNNKSRTLLNRGKRKIQSKLLDCLTYLTIKKKIGKDFDIYHSFFFPLPNLSKYKVAVKQKIITVYDLIPVLMPQFFTEGMQHFFLKELIPSIEIHKDWVICISHSTKKDFCKLTGMPEERVFVTHLGASNNFYKESNTAKIQATLNKYKIPQGRYILGLSTLEPRKNTAHLIRCFFKILSESNYDDVYLVLAGSKGWLYEEVFETADSNSNLKDKVIFTGFIDDEDLSSIYSGASFFVYPSLYEGFGLPPLEAMQCGLPVITSNNSSLPEVVGDAGIMVDATNEAQLCQAMTKLLNDPNLCQQLSKQAFQQSQNFSWEKCAAETIAIYQHILEK